MSACQCEAVSKGMWKGGWSDLLLSRVTLWRPGVLDSWPEGSVLGAARAACGGDSGCLVPGVEPRSVHERPVSCSLDGSSLTLYCCSFVWGLQAVTLRVISSSVWGTMRCQGSNSELLGASG